MKIALLARNPNLYSHKRLIEAAEARGHQIDWLNTLRCTVHIASHKPEVYYDSEPCIGYDAVIPRIGASITNYGLAILRQFEMRGCWPLNESVAIGRSRDKLRSLQILAKHGLGLPLTAYANDPKKAEEIIRAVKGPPVVIKLLEGTQGIGVVLADSMSSAKSVIEAFRGANVNILVQEFIKEAGGTDIRALVIGGKVVAAMKRTGAADDFRSNLHRGGSAQLIKITPEERSTAVRAAKRRRARTLPGRSSNSSKRARRSVRPRRRVRGSPPGYPASSMLGGSPPAPKSKKAAAHLGGSGLLLSSV